MDAKSSPTTESLLASSVHFFMPYFGVLLGIIVGVIIEVIYRPAGMQHTISGNIIETPFWVPEVLAGLWLGWAMYKRVPSGIAFLAWMLPTALLAWSALSWQSAIGDSTWDTYFGRNCQGSECFYQLFLTVPFYSSVAYSVGALIAAVRRTARHGSHLPPL